MKPAKSFLFTTLILFLAINSIECKKYHCNVKIVDLKALELNKVVSCEFYRAIIKANDTVDIALNYPLKGVFENSTVEEISDLVTHIKFKNSNLATIPYQLFTQFPRTEILDASHSKLKSLSPLSLNMSNLTKIFFYHNRLEVLREDVFVHCPNLEILDLSQNNISEIEKFAFNPLSKMEKLDLSENKIKSLKDETFRNLTSLQFLWLSRNQLTKISLNLFTIANKNLISIFMDQNQINSIAPDAFYFLANLRFLFLNGNECISKDFKNHVINDNLAISYEMKKCFKNHEPGRNLSLMIEESQTLLKGCQIKLEVYSATIDMHLNAAKLFQVETTTEESDDSYFES